ncbi:MAG: hypothetical protein AAFV29_12510 [Myxococcota bacterium]
MAGIAAILLSCTACEETLATSPLVGASRVDHKGRGTVAELLRAGRYSYVRFEGAPTGTWHVMMRTTPQVGTSIRYRAYAEAKAFRSAKLGRVFPHLYFSTLNKESSP